jgi:heptose I phosphotransferase
VNKLPSHELSPGFFADPAFVPALTAMGLTTLDSVFAFDKTDTVGPRKLAAHRSRSCFRLGADGPVVYLKRYFRTPILWQLANWLDHRRRACTSVYDGHRTAELDAVGVAVPQTIAYGYEWGGLFEKRSFIMIREIPDAVSLEEQLPACMTDFSPSAARQRKAFIEQVADFVRRFHATGCRHRDLYLCHLFCDTNNALHLIDLHRVFKPLLLSGRFRMKDLAQLYYSSPGSVISRADRLRFYRCYRQKKTLTFRDKYFISQVKRWARRIAVRDRKKGRPAAFES